MPTINGNFIVPKAVLISSSLVMGSGAIYIFYQMYTFSKHLKRLNCQITILTDKVYRAETDIIELRRQLEHANTSDDADDEFVDASEEDLVNVSIPNGKLPNSIHKEKNGKVKKDDTKNLDRILHDLDIKIEKEEFEGLSQALERLNELTLSHPCECEVFWRISHTAYLLSREERLPKDNSEAIHRDLMEQAKKAAEKAVKCNPQSGNAHRWAAIILGSVTQYMPIPEQIKSAFIIKGHIETAIQHRPEDALLYHMMGRWCYSVYMLSWVERKVASALFGTPPTATLEEAMGNFQQSENLDPLSSIPNQLYFAKCYITKGDYKRAVDYLTSGEELQCKNADDRIAQEEIQKLLKQYKSYAS